VDPLITDRLELSALTEADDRFMLALVNEPAWLRYIGDRDVHTREAARRYLLDGPIASYEEHGFGLLRVGLRASGEPVGICGLVKRPSLEHADLGFAFLSAHRSNGYGLESARAVVEHAKCKLALHRLLAITTPDNEPSIGLLRKLGFSREDDRVQDGATLAVFGIELGDGRSSGQP